MESKLRCGLSAVFLLAAAGGVSGQEVTAILFEGRVDRSQAADSGMCEFEFTLWDAAEGGSRVGRTLLFDGWDKTKPRVPVRNGQFFVPLDFGAAILDVYPVFLETRASCGRGAPWSTIGERTEIVDSMFMEEAVVIPQVGQLGRGDVVEVEPFVDPESGVITPDGHSLDAADGDPIDAVYVDNNGNVGVGTLTPSSSLEVAGDLTVGGPIRIDGDNNPLEVHVNGTRAMRFEYADALSAAPNVVIGHPANNVVPQKAGAVIGGGGSATSPNVVAEDWGTVGGGKANESFGLYSTVSGGFDNHANGEGSAVGGGLNGKATGQFSLVSGGLANLASGSRSTVGGGTANNAQNLAATVGGGEGNFALGGHSTIPGGKLNSAGGDYSFAAGRRAKANHLGSFVWGDSTAADVASTANNQFLVRASGGASFSHNLGIGTTTPGIPLTFANTLGNKISLWGQDGAAEHYGFGIQSGTLQIYSPATSKIAFGKGLSGSFTEQMQLSAAGNFGIGTAPSYPLHVYRGASTGNWAAQIANGAAATYFSHGSGYGMHINTGNTNTSAKYAMEVRNASRTHLYVRDDGNVGIGTNAPGSALDVRGDLRVSGLIRSANQDFKIRRGSFTMWAGAFANGATWGWTGISLGTTFSSPPVVIASMKLVNSGGNNLFISVHVFASDVTNSTFSLWARRNGGADFERSHIALEWIAIGQ